MSRQLLTFSPAFMRRRATIAAPAEVWPPSGSPDLYFDFDLGEGYWGGSSKVRSDFIIDVDDGLTSAYRVLWGDLGIPAGEDFTMMVEIDNDALEPEATTTSDLMSFKVTASVHNSLRAVINSQPRGWNAYGNFSHLNPSASGNVGVSNLETGLDNTTAQGRQRIIAARENGVNSRMISSMGKMNTMPGGVNTDTAHPSSNRHLYINQQPGTYGTEAGTANTSGLPIKRIAFWGRALSEAEMFTISRFGRPGILFSGDSFVAGGNLRQEFVKTVEALGKGPVAVAYDGVGGTGLTAHALRYASRPEFWPEYLVIMDGGFETGDGIAAAKAAIDSYLSNLTHDNWVFIEPNPLNALGTPQRDEWNDFFFGAADNTGARELYNYIGADHYIKTYDAMLAAGDGSTEDNAAIASGLWPESTTGDGTHLNDKGLAIFAGLIADYAEAKSWV